MLGKKKIVNEYEETIISLNNHPNYDVYITRSNSRFLSKDISTRFKDRGFGIETVGCNIQVMDVIPTDIIN